MFKQQILKEKGKIMVIKTDILENFCNQAKIALSDYYKEDYDINIQNIRKTNGIILKGLTISKKDQNIVPTIYLNDYYESFKNGKSFADIISNIICVYEDNKMTDELDVEFFHEYEKVRKKLCYKIVNYEMNRELLEDVPHFKFLDLAVVCYCIIINDFIGSGSILIHYNHIRTWGISEKILFEDAKSNMPRLFPMEMKNMTDVIQELFLTDKEENPTSDTHVESIIPDSTQRVTTQLEELKDSSLQMYVLTNKSKLNGASSMLYENVLEDIATLFERDIYILPSSIHEVILIPKNDDIEETYLSRMVNDVNETQLKTEEILSNHAYLYKKDSKQILSLPLIPE